MLKQGKRRVCLAIPTLIFGTLGAMQRDGIALASSSITVDTTHTLATVPATAIGLNTAVWDGHLQDRGLPAQIQSTGASLLRFPGGSTADAYHWQTNSLTPGVNGYVNPANTFDAFMANVVQPAETGTMVTVNYGSNSAGTGGGDPAEAAAWVNYANNVHHYGVKYWEIGNEVYGNGYYGARWETDLHTDHSPAAYAQNAIKFIGAMKQVDPSIEVGLVLTAPGNWPDGQGPEVWNSTVLSTACAQADFVSVHWYAQSPGAESDAGLLASTNSIPGMVQQLRTELTQYCGSHGSQMGIFVTESNSVSYNPGKQTTSPINGLFLMQNYLEWLQAGVQNVSWWDLHNGGDTGNNNSSTLAGTSLFGDFGLLSSGTSGEPTTNTPFPAFTALQLLRSALVPGATFVPVTSGNSAINAFALSQPNGQLALVLVNTSASISTTVTPTIEGWNDIADGTATTFGLAEPQPTTTKMSPVNGAVTYTLQPYSATVLSLTSGASTPATASPIPSNTSTPTIAPSATPTSAPSATPTHTPSPTATATATTVAQHPLVLENFESGIDGFVSNSLVTNVGPSTWQTTVALGNASLWAQYTVPTAWAEARLTRTANIDLSAYTTLSLSVYAKQPTTATGVKVRFDVIGSDNQWYSSPYMSVPTGVRTTVQWNMDGIPRAPLRAVAICWQFTSTASSSGNEIWLDALEASSGTLSTSLIRAAGSQLPEAAGRQPRNEPAPR